MYGVVLSKNDKCHRVFIGLNVKLLKLPNNLHKYLLELEWTILENSRLFTIVKKCRIRAGLS